MIENSLQTIDATVENPYSTPEVDVEEVRRESPLVQKMRRKSGNENILTAAACSLLGLFLPFGTLLELLSLFLLGNVVVRKHRPAWWAVLLAIPVGLWSLLRVAMVAFVLLSSVLN